MGMPWGCDSSVPTTFMLCPHLMNHSVLRRFSFLELSWQLCNNEKKNLIFKKNMIHKIRPPFVLLLCQKCSFITLFSCKIYTPRFTFNLNESMILMCLRCHFKLHETSKCGNYPHFTWDKLFSFFLLMISFGTCLKAQKELINETLHIDRYHVVAPKVRP